MNRRQRGHVLGCQSTTTTATTTTTTMMCASECVSLSYMNIEQYNLILNCFTLCPEHVCVYVSIAKEHTRFICMLEIWALLISRSLFRVRVHFECASDRHTTSGPYFWGFFSRWHTSTIQHWYCHCNRQRCRNKLPAAAVETQRPQR